MGFCVKKKSGCKGCVKVVKKDKKNVRSYRCVSWAVERDAIKKVFGVSLCRSVAPPPNMLLNILRTAVVKKASVGVGGVCVKRCRVKILGDGSGGVVDLKSFKPISRERAKNMKTKRSFREPILTRNFRKYNKTRSAFQA